MFIVLASSLAGAALASGAVPPASEPVTLPSVVATAPEASRVLAPEASPQGAIGYLTAGELADRCAMTDAAGVSYCFAYIAAVHDTMRAYELWLGQREFCVPAGTSQSDLRRAFVTYLSAYPAGRAGQAASVVVVSLKESFPCPRPQPQPQPQPEEKPRLPAGQ